MTSLPRTAHIINCSSCGGDAYDIAWPALLCQDGILHLGARMCEAAPVDSQSIARIASPPSTRRDIARSPAATTMTKSP
jgi:hypothetical protein